MTKHITHGLCALNHVSKYWEIYCVLQTSLNKITKWFIALIKQKEIILKMRGITNKKGFKNVGILLKWNYLVSSKTRRNTVYSIFTFTKTMWQCKVYLLANYQIDQDEQFCQIFLQDIIKTHLNAKIKVTLGWLQRYLQSSPIYWKTVTLCFLQSFQNWEAENFFFKTQVAPVEQQTMSLFNVMHLINMGNLQNMARIQMYCSLKKWRAAYHHSNRQASDP